MATTHFRMDPEQMDAISRELDGLYQSEFGAIVHALRAVDADLDRAWVGGSRQAFQAQFGGWLRATEPLGQTLVLVAHFLRAAAAEYRRLDAERAQADLVPAHHRPHTGRTTGPTLDAWQALLASLPDWQITLLNSLVDLWQRGLPSPFVRGGGGGGGVIGASAGAVRVEIPDWLQAIIDFFTGGGQHTDPIPEPQINNLGEDGCVTTDEHGNVLYNAICSPPEPQAEPSFLQWLFGNGSAPLVPGGPLVDVPVLVPAEGQGEDDDERGSGSGSGGSGPRGGGGGGDDILDDITRPVAGNGNRIPETIEEARFRVGDERFDALAWDPDRKRMRPEEAQVILDLENRGIVAGPVDRGGYGADYFDTTGLLLDVKQFSSHHPPAAGGFDLERHARDIQSEVALGETIVVDTRNMTETDTLLLAARVHELGIAAHVIWWP